MLYQKNKIKISEKLAGITILMLRGQLLFTCPPTNWCKCWVVGPARKDKKKTGAQLKQTKRRTLQFNYIEYSYMEIY